MRYRGLKEIRERFNQGENVLGILRKEDGRNELDSILISYDLQSGSYREHFKHNPDPKENYCNHLAESIDELGGVKSILHVGVGECITLALTLNRMKRRPERVFALDISWSRLHHGRVFCEEQGVEGVELMVADLFRIPLPDNSVDLVLTNHSLEPNGGREREALKELCRVANKYVLMNEPAYEFADEKGRARIDEMGYVKNLGEHARQLGYSPLKHEPFICSMNPTNPTGTVLLDVSGPKQKAPVKPFYVCPVSHLPLEQKQGVLCAEDGMLVYPILNGIPCLHADNGIVASHFV